MNTPRFQWPQVDLPISSFWLARLRTLVTLLALGALVLFAVQWGFGAVTEPFPERAEAPVCVDTPVQVDDILRPAAITVSVFNAGGRDGLAGRTLSDLADQGFARGDIGDAPDDSDVIRVAVWSDDPSAPDVKLVRSYLGGKKVRIINRRGSAPGITVIVGDKFGGVRKGRSEIVASSATTVCTPPALS